MSTYKNLISLGVAAVFALGLAACSSSGDGTPPANDGSGGDTKPPKSALSYATDLNTSVMALGTLAGAVTADGSALKMAATAAGKLGVLDAGGDSSTETMSAQAILDAKQDLADAVADATAKKTAAETAKSGTSDADVIAALDGAITAATTAITAAQELLDAKSTETGSLASYVDMVTGGKDADPQGTPASKGKAVADLIHSALTRANGLATLVTDNFDSNVPTVTSSTVGEVMAGPSDAQGMTWAQIGGSGLKDMRIGTSGGNNRSVKAKSVAGMTAGDLFSTLPNRNNVGTEDGNQTGDDVSYKGIEGVLFCTGSDCKVAGTGGTLAAADKLTGSWYFAPDAASTATYIAGSTAGTYALEGETSYVRYGYWLTVAGANDTTTINRYTVGPPAQTADAVYGISSTVDAFKDSSASYKGSALGMSVVWETDTKGKEVTGSRASGGFTADVDLKMTFGIDGADAALKGTISNFQGSGVDSSWSVDLDSQNLTDGVFSADGVTDGGGTAGAWTATAWGGSDTSGSEARPTGVYGAFDAGFTNGAAAGVYATRKQ